MEVSYAPTSPDQVPESLQSIKHRFFSPTMQTDLPNQLDEVLRSKVVGGLWKAAAPTAIPTAAVLECDVRLCSLVCSHAGGSSVVNPGGKRPSLATPYYREDHKGLSPSQHQRIYYN